MARIRSIHPGLWTDEEFVLLSPFARLLFMGIWNECDDKGLFEWKPITLKMRLLPADNIDAAALLDEIAGSGAIRRYEIDGKAYGAVRNFCKFQRPKKPNDVFPATAEILAFCACGSEIANDDEPRVRNQFPTGGEKPKQMEDGGGNRSSVSNDTGADAPSSDKEFWDNATQFLGGKRSLIGKWCKDYGKAETAKAITAAQIERAVDPQAYISAALRKRRLADERPRFVSPC